MAKIEFDDGKEVILSKETTERLRKELLKPTPPKDFEYLCFSMKISENGTHLIIDTDNVSRKHTKVVRNLKEAIEIRNQLNVFIDYLKEI